MSKPKNPDQKVYQEDKYPNTIETRDLRLFPSYKPKLPSIAEQDEQPSAERISVK